MPTETWREFTVTKVEGREGTSDFHFYLGGVISHSREGTDKSELPTTYRSGGF